MESEILRKNKDEEVEKMRKGLNWIVERGLGFVTVARRRKEEVEKMRKGLSVIVGIAILLFAYSASAGVVTSNLVSWWTFDDSAAPGNDDWTNNNDGTLEGDAYWTNVTAGPASDGALYVNGSFEVKDNVNCGTNSSLDITDAITIEAWVKADSFLPTRQAIVSKAAGAGGEAFILEIYGSGPRCYIGAERAIGSNIATGQWYHLLATFDKDLPSNNIKLYIDGDFNAQATRTTAMSIVEYPARIGAVGPTATSFFHGIVDEVRIYDRALTVDEIKQNYDAIPEPSTLLLLGGGLLSLLAFRRRGRR